MIYCNPKPTIMSTNRATPVQADLEDVKECHETSDVGTGDRCPAGSYCPEASPAAIKCAAGSSLV